MNLDEGDEMEYGLSIEVLPGVWAKASVKGHVREGESPAECWQRLSTTVDGLLQHHARELEASLRNNKT
jgi:hypothetical protein